MAQEFKNVSNTSLNESARRTLLVMVCLSLLFLGTGFIFGYLDNLRSYSWLFTVAGVSILLIAPVARLLIISWHLIKGGSYRYTLLALLVICLMIAGVLIGK